MRSEATLLQFEGFTLDVTRRQLSRGGDLLPVTGKAFDLLVYLSANAGRPLDKSEILNAVWPDSFVEESNLTQNIFLLRKVLGSGPASPIKTLPGKGYIFAATVTPVPTTHPTPVTLEATHTRVVVEEETEHHIPAWRSPWIVTLSAIGLILLIIAGALGWQRYEDHVGGPPVQAVLATLTSNTGDPILDHTLEDALRIDLAQSPFVTVVSSANVRRTLVEMAHKPDEALTAPLAHDVCERTGSQVVIEQNLAKSGDRYLLTMQATNCVDGAIIAADHREASTAADLPSAMQKAASTVRHSLGESRRSIARFNAQLFPIVTPSLEALEDYSQAFRLGQKAKYQEAISLLKHATTLDPNFATAYLDLATYSADSSDFQAQHDYLLKAYALRDHATEPVRRLILTEYDAEITGDLHQSVQDITAWTELYPHSIAAFASLAQVYRQLDRFADSAAAMQRAIALSPNYGTLYYGLADQQLASGNIAAAKATATLSIQRGFDTDTVHMVLYRIAYLTHDDALLHEEQAWCTAHPNSVYTLYAQAQAAQSDGRLKESRTLLAAVTRALQDNGQASLVRLFEQQTAITYLYLDDEADARPLAHLDYRDDASPNTAILMASLGDINGASADLARHLHASPTSTLWTQLHGPWIQSRIALHSNRPEDALNALTPAADFLDRDLDLRYARASALEALHRWPEAEADLRFILDHRFIDAESATIPAAEFDLGIALKQQGKTDAAHQAFLDFLAHWSHADADAALYKRAQQELKP